MGQTGAAYQLTVFEVTPPPVTQWAGPSADQHRVESDAVPLPEMVKDWVQKLEVIESWQATVTDEPGENPDNDTEYQ